MLSNLGLRNTVHCLFKVPRLVCFVLINPPFSNTERRQCYYSSGSAREKRATPLPGEEARDRGQSWQRTCTGLEVRWRVTFCNLPAMFLWRTRHDSPWVFYVFTKRGPSFLPFYYFPKAKEPCASQNDDGDCVKRRMVMKSGSLTESLLDSLVSFVLVVTCVYPKTTTSIYRCT